MISPENDRPNSFSSRAIDALASALMVPPDALMELGVFLGTAAYRAGFVERRGLERIVGPFLWIGFKLKVPRDLLVRWQLRMESTGAAPGSGG